jgi:hypothetical protein
LQILSLNFSVILTKTTKFKAEKWLLFA